jgi:hypothetical protein
LIFPTQQRGWVGVGGGAGLDSIVALEISESSSGPASAAAETGEEYMKPLEQSSVCPLGLVMDLFHHDAHEFTQHEVKERYPVFEKLCRKYRHLSRNQWIEILGRCVAGVYRDDVRDGHALSERADHSCQFREMLELFHGDMHDGASLRVGREERTEIERTTRAMTSDFGQWSQRECIGMLGDLIFQLYTKDSRLVVPGSRPS